MFRRLLLVILAMCSLFSCSSKTAATGESKDTDKPTPSTEATAACSRAAKAIASPGFPQAFPTILNVTWTLHRGAGPSTIVNGYSTRSLNAMYAELTKVFAAGDYKVAKAEHDEHDAEVNFTSSKNTGQVRLSDACPARVTVIVTIRPK